MSAAEASLRELVAHAGQVLTPLGLVDYLGHASARIPDTDRVVVKPKHSPAVRSMAARRPDDMVVVDLDGSLLEGTARPPAEEFIHTAIYRDRSDVAAVVRTHQRAATLAGVLGLPIQPVMHVPATFVPADPPTWPHPVLVGRWAYFCDLAAAGVVR